MTHMEDLSISVSFFSSVNMPIDKIQAKVMTKVEAMVEAKVKAKAEDEINAIFKVKF